MRPARRQQSPAPSQPADTTAALIGALTQSAQIEARVEECAEEISAITAVLKEEMTPRHTSNDAEQALAQSEQLRQKIEQCAEELHSLNTALSREMRERRKSERALAGMQVRLIGAQVDVLEARTALTRARDEKERARSFAFHDTLTGLANRNLFGDRLEHALAHAKRHRNMLAVMSVDIDQFKRISETHALPLGDKVLQAVAQRLLSSVRAADTVCREEGDRFLLLLEELNSTDDAGPVARKLVQAVAQPLEIDGVPFNIAVNIGISVYPHDGDTVETLISNADCAVTDAKRDAGGHAFFSRGPH
jgi:diguanylate cyclase (GGDEF)-like protein